MRASKPTAEHSPLVGISSLRTLFISPQNVRIFFCFKFFSVTIACSGLVYAKPTPAAQFDARSSTVNHRRRARIYSALFSSVPEIKRFDFIATLVWSKPTFQCKFFERSNQVYRIDCWNMCISIVHARTVAVSYSLSILFMDFVVNWCEFNDDQSMVLWQKSIRCRPNRVMLITNKFGRS